MKTEHVIADREGWYALIFCWHQESGLFSASLKLPRAGRIVSVDDYDEAVLLLDVLLAQLGEGYQYRNGSFLLQRNYDRVEAKLDDVSFPSYPYDLFALVGEPFAGDWEPDFSKTDYCDYIGSLPPHKFLELSSKLSQLYSTSEPLGMMRSSVSPPWAKDVPRMHEWEDYHELPRTPIQWLKDNWDELNRSVKIWLLARKSILREHYHDNGIFPVARGRR